MFSFDKLKQFFHQYGLPGILLHISISFLSLIWISLLFWYGFDLTMIITYFGGTHNHKYFGYLGNYALIFLTYEWITPIRFWLLFSLLPIVIGSCRRGSKENNDEWMDDLDEQESLNSMTKV